LVTSFANPEVTIARSLSDTCAGIAPGDAPAFVASELSGALAAAALFAWLFGEEAKRRIEPVGAITRRQ
jgi:hypothetical protein